MSTPRNLLTLNKPVDTALSKPVDTFSAPSAGKRLRGFITRFGMVWVLIALALVSAGLYPGFFAPGNLNNLFGQIAPVAIVAIGMTFVIISGGFDLSVTAVFAASAVAYASFSNVMPLGLAFVGTLLVALIAGVFNGVIITALRINPFIATLASASLISGATYLVTAATPVISNAKGFETLGVGKINGIWISIFMLVALALIAAFVLARTPYGRSIYAVGGNQEAARLAGMRVNLIRVSAFGISAICAGIGGTIVASQTGVGQANIGSTITLDSIAIVIVGGTSLLGGEGGIWRTGIGILIWGTITNLFGALALNTSAQLLMQGAIVLIAVALDSLSRRGRR